MASQGLPTFGRLEYLTHAGWVLGHAGISLLDPVRYVTRLATARPAGQEVYGRFTELVDFEARNVWQTPDVPLPEDVPRRTVPMTRITECAECGRAHETPWSCLL